jgi:hypothetical protein
MNSQMKSALKIVLDMYISEELDNFGESYDAGCSKEDLKDLFEGHILYSLLMLKHEGDVNNVNKEFEIFWSEIDPEDEDSEDEDSEDEEEEEVLKDCKCDTCSIMMNAEDDDNYIGHLLMGNMCNSCFNLLKANPKHKFQPKVVAEDMTCGGCGKEFLEPIAIGCVCDNCKYAESESDDEEEEEEEVVAEVVKCCYKCSSTTKLHEYAPPPNGSGKSECDVCTTAESNRLKAESIRQEPKRGFGIHQTPCSTPCTPRYDFIGRSWNKRMGYNSTCKCAFLEADKRGLLEPNGVFFTEESGVDNPIRGCV